MMNLIKKLGWVGVLIFAVILFSGCEQDESNELAQAQACLDALDADATTEANNCATYISGRTDQQAKIIMCSIKFMVGGVTTSRVADAFIALAENESAKKEAIFITALAFNSKTEANDAYSECNASGVDALIYIAGLARTGTYMATLISSGGFTPGDIANESQIAEAVTKCQVDPDCTTTLGENAGDIAASYCEGKEDDVCTDINAAVASGASNNAIGAELLDLLNQ